MSSVIQYFRRPSLTARDLFMKRMLLIVPPFFAVGAGMELFMIKTGFYDVATRKEAERRLEAEDLEYQQYRREKKLREQQQQRQARA